jgi:ABC-type transporter Mla MlaB component
VLALVDVLHINGELERWGLLVLLQQHEEHGNQSASEKNTDWGS